MLTLDIKILARILATRLAKVISRLVHTEQSGFIPSRSTALIIRSLFLNIQVPVENTGNRAILSLNAAKAFDRMECKYLWAVLGRFGLGEGFISWIKLLYFALTVRIHIVYT